jgi:5-methyltetrahydrofolate--homocysteine methyltransferase
MNAARLPLVQAPVPPFLGTRVLDLELDQALPWVNRPALFRGRWGYPVRPPGETAPVTAARPVETVLADVIDRCRRDGLIRARAVYGYFPCAAEGDDLAVLDETGVERLRFHFRRQKDEPRRSLADFFRPAAAGGDCLALQLVTTGPGVPEAVIRAEAEHRYLEMLHLHGFAAALAEALAEQLHHRIRSELGLAGDESGDPGDAFRHRYRGRRFSFGYPACPDLADQEKLFRLLRPERIGVTLTPRFQMVPEHTTSALVAHHPDARHFAV